MYNSQDILRLQERYSNVVPMGFYKDFALLGFEFNNIENLVVIKTKDSIVELVLYNNSDKADYFVFNNEICYICDFVKNLAYPAFLFVAKEITDLYYGFEYSSSIELDAGQMFIGNCVESITDENWNFNTINQKRVSIDVNAFDVYVLDNKADIDFTMTFNYIMKEDKER